MVVREVTLHRPEEGWGASHVAILEKLPTDSNSMCKTGPEEEACLRTKEEAVRLEQRTEMAGGERVRGEAPGGHCRDCGQRES